ncbi:MAG: hypothetical protein WC540_14610, partial [Sulfuritalea sp.]
PAAISSEAACLLNCFMFVAPIPVETSVGTASDASLLPDRRCDELTHCTNHPLRMPTVEVGGG